MKDSRSSDAGRFFRPAVQLAAALLLAGACGCVERVMKISSDPGGARVFLNDEEVGLTPVTVAFLWYGDYDVILRKEGYETLKTHYRVHPPWYQFPPADIVAETLVPGTIRDVHVLPTYELAESLTPPAEEVVQRAAELRERALLESP